MSLEWGDERSRSTNIVKLIDSFKKIKIGTLFSMKRHPYDNLIAMFNFSLLFKIIILEAVLLTCKDIFGEEISCVFNEPPKVLKKKFIDYCWIDGGYTVIPRSSDYSSPYIGVTSSVLTDDGSKYYHRYYQWVYLSLLIQSGMFFSLKWIWNHLLDRRVIDIIGKVKEDRKNLYEYSKPEQIYLVQSVADLLFSGVTFYNNVILMELICLAHLIFQIWATDRFLNGNFLRLGIIWLESTYSMKSITSLFMSSASTSSSNPIFQTTMGDHSYSNSFDPLQLIFPRMVKCSLQFYGPSGDINSYDGMCFLAANSLHEKIYLCQWFLYHFILIFIILTMIYRAAILIIPPLRYHLLSYNVSSYATRSYRDLLNTPGNYFLLSLLSSTIPTSHFIDLMDAVLETHFDKYRNPLYNSAFGEYAKAHPGIKVDRNVKQNKSHKKVEESKSWTDLWNAKPANIDNSTK